MIGQAMFSKNSGKTNFANLFSDGKPIEVSRDFVPIAPFVLLMHVVPSKSHFDAEQ